MDTERIWLKHSVTGGEFECPAEAVEAWRGRGWIPISELEAAAASETGADEDTSAEDASTPAGAEPVSDIKQGRKRAGQNTQE